ncbi:MAG: DUF1842 domain-containing protein [Bacteroidetes bacterium]|jgi:hypothetical protein|nr:DUF1842 domain-containing protein [Bacteroidota bacterium]
METSDLLTDSTNTSTLIGAYLVNGTAGNVGMPGAPIMHFSLVVVPSANSVSGTVEITQAIPPPNSQIVIRNVTGSIHELVFGPNVTYVIALEGVYYHTLTPPAIGTIQEKFEAHLAVDGQWNGKGSFSYGNRHVDNVPVKKTN